jgi:hypothetical protein
MLSFHYFHVSKEQEKVAGMVHGGCSPRLNSRTSFGNCRNIATTRDNAQLKEATIVLINISLQWILAFSELGTIGQYLKRIERNCPENVQLKIVSGPYTC